ncbi:GGDEF domain-containing protein [Blastococcus sp. TF02A_35]|uniref:GGDEF domain-containing protein n=1 Tax=Blastococcus sp. TF02A-35 TaxID=2559612 RepID=UPI0010736856|nr:GGDEF domain-containing protein [Blastococcus sp. TF02A_35]TFV51547.1 GGDEF domain-containing protein [Blastococcus sp. TF02A_35]
MIDPLRKRVRRDAGAVALATVILACLSLARDLPAHIATWSAAHFPLGDDVILVIAGAHAFMLIFGLRRAKDLRSQAAERQSAVAELRHRATHDPLTNLYNRSEIISHLEEALAETDPVWRGAVLLIDLDGFKGVNDSFGHHAGDRVLAAVALRMSGEFRADARVGRLGGDEFVIVLPESSLPLVADVARRLIEVIRQPYAVDGHRVTIGASVGVARVTGYDASGAPDQVPRPEQPTARAAALLRQADAAMYHAKRTRSGLHVHDAVDPDGWGWPDAEASAPQYGTDSAGKT